jgi:hypothetical protein
MRRQTNYTSLWSTSSSSIAPSSVVPNAPARVTRRATGEFSYVSSHWTMDFFEIVETVIDMKTVYFDQVKITGGVGPVPTTPLHNFFDGTRLYISDDPSRQPDGSFRSMYERKIDPNHFEIRQSSGTFVLKSLSAIGTKVNQTVVPQGESVVLRNNDRIEDRVMFTCF